MEILSLRPQQELIVSAGTMYSTLCSGLLSTVEHSTSYKLVGYNKKHSVVRKLSSSINAIIPTQNLKE
jgi:hypothetical protein